MLQQASPHAPRAGNEEAPVCDSLVVLASCISRQSDEGALSISPLKGRLCLRRHRIKIDIEYQRAFNEKTTLLHNPRTNSLPTVSVSRFARARQIISLLIP